MANTPQSYTSKFRTLTPAKLAEIIVREEDYHPDAVTAARLELTARMLPTEELDRIYDLAEEQKINSGSDGMKIGFGKSAKVEAVKNTFKDKINSSIWGRTNALKLILGYLMISLAITIYYLAANLHFYLVDSSLDLVSYLTPQLIAPLLYLFLIWLGFKGSKAAWWGLFILFSVALLVTLLNAYHTFQYYRDIEEFEANDLSGLIYQLVDDPYMASIKLIIATLFLYLTISKNTRVACGVAKGEEMEIDELDHLI